MNNTMIQFKEQNLRDEFNSVKIDSRLKKIIYALAGYINFNFCKALVITELLRTQEMQDEYYKNDPDYRTNKWLSVHQFGRGADVSLKYFTDSEVAGLKEFLHNFEYGHASIKTALFHKLSDDLGYHLHLQVDNNSYTRIIL